MGRDFVFQIGQLAGAPQTGQNADGVTARFASVNLAHGSAVDAWIHPQVEGDHLPFKEGDRVGLLYAYDDPGSAFVLFQVGAGSLGEGDDRTIRARAGGSLRLIGADGKASVVVSPEGAIQVITEDGEILVSAGKGAAFEALDGDATVAASGAVELEAPKVRARRAGRTSEAVQLHATLAKEMGVLFQTVTAHAAALDALAGGVPVNTEALAAALVTAGIPGIVGGEAAATLEAEAAP